MRKPSRHRLKSSSLPGGFTLIELLSVITIIAILAGLILPVTQNITTRAYDTKCMSNLRQIGVAANAAANDNNGIFPLIEYDSNGTQVADTLGEPAQPMDVALKPYGITADTLQCPADIHGPNDYATKHTSYMWSPYAEDNNATGVPSIISRRRGQISILPSKLQLATDWEAVHFATDQNNAAGKMIYTLYADGHVRTTRRTVTH